MNDKIFVIEYVERWSQGGRESYVVNLVKGLDKSKFDIRIFTSQKESDYYDEELESVGIKIESILNSIYEDPIVRVIKTMGSFKETINRVRCDVIHLHVDQGVALMYAFLSKKVGVKKVISHCHNAGFGEGHEIIKSVGHNIGKRIFRNYIDIKIACSEKAENWMYTTKDIKNKNVVIQPYLVDMDLFIFDANVRKAMRDENNIPDNEFVFIHVGRHHYQKNPVFLIEMFARISKKIDARLFLVGDGELHEDLKRKVKELGLNDKIIFVGTTKVVHRYLNMADAFLLPSIYEGNPIVITEAQACGLPCFISDTITPEAKILDTTFFIDIKNIDESTKVIIDSIEKDVVKHNDRNLCNQIVREKGYDCVKQIRDIEFYYNMNL